MDLAEHIKRELLIPCIMIDFDHADERKYSESNAFLRMETLLEAIDLQR